MLRFLWWIVLSALYCLNAWWMYVPWTVKITYLFFIMFHLCLIGFYSRFIIFHWFVQCALHVLIMFIHVFNCFGMLLLFFIGLFWFWYFFWLFIDICAVLNWMLHHVHWFFNCFFVKMEVGHTICSPMVPSTIVNMDDGGKNLFSITVPC